MTHATRVARARVLETLESRVKQFRWREELKPFRVPHEPLVLEAIIDEALAEEDGYVREDDLRARTLLRMEWDDGHAWNAWAIALPSGITVYCDSDEDETRVLASVRRGSQVEADRFFLELLAESSGHYFGIETSGDAPDRVRTAMTDREFLADFFVELFEGSAVERAIHRAVAGARRPASDAAAGRDFRQEVSRWLERVLIVPTPAKARSKRVRRLREESE